MGYLKQIGTLLLCGLLFMRAMIAPVIFFNFEINKAFIIENYCINKNRPQLHCDGKCYLAKKLQAAQEKEENQSKMTVYKLWLEVFYQAIHLPQKTVFNTAIGQFLNYFYNNCYNHSCIISLLKPPKRYNARISCKIESAHFI